MRNLKFIALLGLGIILTLVVFTTAVSDRKRHRLIIGGIAALDQRVAIAEQSVVQAGKALLALDERLKTYVADAQDQKSDLRTRLGVIHPTTRGVNLKGIAEPVAIKRLETGPFTPVSMARIGPGQFLVVNYRNVYLFDIDQREATPVELEGTVPIWNPTAVHYSAFYDRVFIANYTGKDILVAELVRDGGHVRLRLTERIVHDEGIKGPEGVQVSPGGRYMAVADYDGGALSVFERVNDHWKYRWKKSIESSHGVAILGSTVYGAGTSIAKFNIETGEELARISKIGNGRVLFAACISEDEENGDLIGSDTMAGRVFLLSKDLELKKEFGANGPTYVNLSMPYCAYRDGEDIYVLSTYQDRIIRIGRNETRSFEFGGARWQYVNDPALYRNRAGVWAGVTKFDHPTYEMFGKTVSPSYGALKASDGTALLLPAPFSEIGNKWLFYVSTFASDENWIVIAANSSPIILLYNRRTGDLGYAEIGEWDCWAMSTSLMCPSRSYSVPELVAKSKMLDPHLVTDNRIDLIKTVGLNVPLIAYWRSWRTSLNELPSPVPSLP